MRYSALDSAPVPRRGGTPLRAALDRAAELDRLGCHRLWFTEHHLAADVASTAPLLLAGQAAAVTRSMRVGSGGVMIRNHPPLVVAEQAALLSRLFPERIDLGLGRAGGSDPGTDARLRRTIVDYADFEADVRETVHCLGLLQPDGVQVVILGSSAGTGEFAGRHGWGLAVAGHVAPAGITAAIHRYRECFRPVAGRSPWVILCLPVVTADSTAEARRWFRTVQQRYLDRLRSGGAPLVEPDDAALDWSASERYRVEAMLAAALVGSADTVRRDLGAIRRRWRPDEVMAMTDLADSAATMTSHALMIDLLTRS